MTHFLKQPNPPDMTNSISHETKRIIRRKARQILAMVPLTLLLNFESLAQPTWIAGTPVIYNISPSSVTIDYGINTAGTVYFIVWNYDNTEVLSSPVIKSLALTGPTETIVAAAVRPVTAGTVNTVLQEILGPLQSTTMHTLYIVAESSGGVLQATPIRFSFTTLPCPKIDILTGFSQPISCVNLGATARFQVVLADTATSGILKGTQWTIEWGDGTPITNFTSSVDYEIPPLALRQHTYTAVTSCNYVFSSIVSNPCGETRTVQYVAVVHGRDIPSDGDGWLGITDNANGSSVIQVCEGTQTVITLRDNSTWNCQNPVLPGGLIPVPNSDPRQIEWLYGRDPSGNTYNTITGNVAIVTLGIAPLTSGRISPFPYGPNSLSHEIIIPATARAGEYFRVYLKNWNKCNWADPDYVSTYVDIEVVATPPSPTAPSSVVCIGEDKTLEVTSTPMGTITWYSDAALTTLLGTGLTFVPSQTAAGTYNYYVTDREASGLLCQSAPTTVSLTISPKPDTPEITYPNKNNICYGVEPPESYTITASVSSTPSVSGFQWYSDGVLLPGRTYDTIYITKPWETGRYTVRAVGAAPSYCLGDSSTGRSVTVHELVNVIPPEDQEICQNGTAIFHASTTMEIHQYQWEVSYNGGVLFSTVGNAAPYNGFNTNTLTITNPATSFSGYIYRLEMMTSQGQGGCRFKSPPAMLTIDTAPTVNAGPDQWICALSNVQLAGNIGGSATSATWSGGTGTFNPNNTTLNAIYTPSQAERDAQIVTLTLTTNDPSGICPPASDDITITIGTIPILALLTTSGDGCFGDAQSWINLDIYGGGEPYIIKYNINGAPRPDLTNYFNRTIRNIGILPVGVHTIQVTEIRDNCGNVLTSAGLPGPATIQIYQNPIAVAGTDQYFCGTLSANLSAVPSIGTGTWSLVSGPGTASFSPNANSAGATITVSTPGSYVLRWTEINGGICVSSSDKAIYFERIANAGPDQGLCGMLTATMSGNAPTTGTGTWTRVSGPGTATFSPDANFPSATATVSAYGSYVFRWRLSNGTCSTEDNVTIVYNPAGQVNQPANLVVCNGSLITPPAFTTVNTGGTTTYLWSSDAVDIGLPASGSGNLPAFTAVNTDDSFMTATITVTPTFSNGSVDCPGPVQTFTITVNPTPNLISSLTPPDVCSNTPFSYNPSSATAGTTFRWDREEVTGITPAGPTTGFNNPNEILMNFTNIPIGVTYQYTLTANECSNIQNVTVNVRPEPVIVPGQVADINSGNTVNHHINLENFTNPGDNVLFTWPAPVLSPVNPAFTGGSARNSASAVNITDIFTNITGVPGTATYTVTPYKDGCAGAPENIMIIIRSQPVIDDNLNRTVCSNTPIGLMLKEATGSVPIDYYNILQVTLDAGLSADPGNNSIPNPLAPADYLLNDKYLNITGLNKNVRYTVQPVCAPDCYGDPVQIVITISPQPYTAPALIKTVCSGVPIEMEILLSPPNIPAGTIFNWPAPTLSDFSGQGSAGVNVAADPAGKIHINDVIYNYSGIPITATYNITPTSAQGCEGNTIPVIITINPEPAPKPISGRNSICTGEINLVYYVAPSEGSVFTWSVDPVLGTKIFDYNTNAIIIDASPASGSGNITVFETSSYGCNGPNSVLPVQVHTQALPEIISGPSEVCALSTEVYSVSLRPGSVYSWNIPAGAVITGNPTASAITVVFGNTVGTISVSEINLAGCITNHIPLSLTVRSLPTATITGGAIFCEGSNASVSIDFSGNGPFVFTYAIDGVPQAPVVTSADPYTLNVTLAGTYTIVNVTDATGCTNSGSGSADVSYYPSPTGIISGGATICSGDGSTITLSFTGTAPFTFTYTDGVTPFTVPNWPNPVYLIEQSPAVTSTYTLVSVTDGNNCNGTVAGSAEIIVNPPPGLTLTGTNLTCNNDNTGAVDLTITGNSPFGIAWTGPLGFTANTEDISGLQAGTYNLTVIDTRGCISTGSVTLTESGALNANLASSNISCFGLAEGTITISDPSGGSGSYEYTIDGGLNWQGSGNFTNRGPGTYIVMIRDAANPTCVVSFPPAIVITEPPELTATVSSTNVTCFGASDGSITISGAGGGHSSYEYSINGGASWQASGIYTGLTPGTYSVMIRDAGFTNCYKVLNGMLLITQPAVLGASVSSTMVTCFGADDGTISITGVSGGSGSYQYTVTGGAPWLPSGLFTGLTPGSYDVRIRDAVNPGCILVLNTTLVITQPLQLAASASSTNVTCFGIDDGTIIISSPAGGYGTYEYTINGGIDWWPTGLFTALIPATYDVRIRDAENSLCSLILNPALTVSPAESAVLTSVLTPLPVCSGSVFNYIATCTNPEAQLAWSRTSVAGISESANSGSGNIAEVLTNTADGPVDVSYLYTITSGECVNVQNVTVTVYPAPFASAGGSQAICLGDSATVTGAKSSNGVILWTSNGNGGLSGSHTLSPTYTPLPEETGKTITLTLTVSGTGACELRNDSAVYSVFVRDNQTIAFGPLMDKTYGDPPFLLSASSSSALEVNYTSSNNSVVTITGKTASIKGTGTAIIYANQPGDPNHCPAPEVSSTIRVNARSITVKADPLQSKVYGDADPVLTYSVSPALVGNDSLTGSLKREPGENAGTGYEIMQGNLEAGQNYIITFVPGRFTISVKPVTVTANPGQHKTYGSTDPQLTYLIRPALPEGDEASGSLSRRSGENAGSYMILQGSFSLGNNYSIRFIPSYFVINKAPLYVTADNKVRRYLEPNPDFTLSYSGFVQGEGTDVLDVRPSLSVLAGNTSDAGTYSIDVSGGSDENYSFIHIKGILTILKADQFITSFNELPKFLRTTQEFQLEGTASSGLPVTFESSDEKKATILENTLTIVKEGAVNISAKQEGNHNWNPAPEIIQTVIGQPTFDNITSLFTPNNDGMNDYWHITDLEELGSVEVKVYNRFGKLVYESSEYKNDWKGNFNGQPLPSASYYYIIKSSKKGIIRGVLNIVR
jgi:gliding motility-associated-like protein